MKSLNASALVFLSFALVLVLPVVATGQAAVPLLVNYQGELRSPTTGEPVPDGSYDMVFRIYGVASAGTALWTGTHSTANGNPVAVIGGILSVSLGSGTGNVLEASVLDGPDRWLEIQVGTETLSPRQRITSVAYSIISENSRLLSGREATEFANNTHAHSGNDITSGTVTEAWIDPLITRDSERDTAIAAHAAISNAHHARYTDAEAVGAMGAKSPNNPLNHDKTTKFSELTDVAADAQIPAAIARDTEVTSAISTHSGISDAHHAKTTKFSELTDVAADAQIPASVARDSEVSSAISSHTAIADAHHARYTNAEAVAAMGAKANTNPLNHDKTTTFSELSGTATDAQIPATIARDAEVTSAVSTHSAIADAHHAKTTSFADLTDTATDAQIPNTITINHAASAGDADTVDGAHAAALEESAEIDSDIAAHTAIASAHHARYTNSEAVAAMGAIADSNPLNHDKTTSLAWGSITSIPPGFADGVDNDSGAASWFLTGNTGTSGANFLGTADNQPLELRVSNARALRLEPNTTSPNLIGGYSGNAVTSGAYGATIGGGGLAGYTNSVTDAYGTIGGGAGNQAGDNAGTTYDASCTTVGGGWQNTASGDIATVGGGYGNTASGYIATVGGGWQNSASGDRATVAGGIGNAASGLYATVPGGFYNEAIGDQSFAAGTWAIAHGNGSFVWGDSNDFYVEAWGANEFVVRATGGYRLFSGVDGWGNPTAGATLAAGSGTWGSWCDRNAKTDCVPADSREVLEKVAALPISTWSYKTQDPSVRHMGPMAQDFYAAFGLAEDDKRITTVDADGVSLAAIQGLYEIVQQKDEKISCLEKKNTELERRLKALEELVRNLSDHQGDRQ